MTTFVWRDGLGCVDKRLAPPLVEVFARAPGVIRDTMDAVVHPITGKLMDSKSEFRKITRANGCVEVGNETQRIAPPIYDRAELQRDIVQAMQSSDHQPAATANIEGHSLDSLTHGTWVAE